MRKALVVGINYYEHVSSLHGCVNDANAVKSVLERNGDGTVNFDVRLQVSNAPTSSISRRFLKRSIEDLFSDDIDIALLFFAGHGYVEASGGGYLVTSECESGDDGVSLSEILSIVNNSHARNKLVILDSCHSGIAGARSTEKSISEIKDGTTILTASTEQQYATEENGRGVFSTLFVDALKGSAANIVGEITPGSIYAHIDQSLGAWDQRPIFKTNVRNFVSLRKVPSPISISELKRVTEFFPSPDHDFRLDPTYEPERASNDTINPPPNPINTEIFAILQKFNRVNLVVPVDAPHMWHAAMQNKSCRLTELGKHYRRIVESGRI